MGMIVLLNANEILNIFNEDNPDSLIGRRVRLPSGRQFVLESYIFQQDAFAATEMSM